MTTIKKKQTKPYTNCTDTEDRLMVLAGKEDNFIKMDNRLPQFLKDWFSFASYNIFDFFF